MDFFGQQDLARTRTKRLLLIFTGAIFFTALVVYLVLAAALRLTYLGFGEPAAVRSYHGPWISASIHYTGESIWSWALFSWVVLVVLLVIAIGALYKAWRFRRGGPALAEHLGGRPLNLQSDDFEERRLQNIVEEMSIASGVPTPSVYILDEEFCINAFAAGYGYSDAVIGVTFGALKLLDRDETQAVVAHEFSHILNGDMQLNLRLVSWLHGIFGLVVLGRILMVSLSAAAGKRGALLSTSDDDDSGMVWHPSMIPLFVIGVACALAGSLGGFFARCIKSAVSRQREYLADASAVQFTRNAEGLAGALKKIGGLRRSSALRIATAEEASHLYFSDGIRNRWISGLSTHPPLIDRIRRLEPNFNGRYARVSPDRALRENKVTALYRREGGGKPLDMTKLMSVIGVDATMNEMIFAAAAAREKKESKSNAPRWTPPSFQVSPAHLEYAALFAAALPEAMRQEAHEPFGALALVYAMLLSQDATTREAQWQILNENTEPGVVKETRRFAEAISQLDERAYLPLVDLCLPALRQLSRVQYETFRENLTKLVEHDRQIDLFEYCLQRIVERRLDPCFGRIRKRTAHYYAIKPLAGDCAILLSGMAHLGSDDEEAAKSAFQIGAARIPTSDDALRFLPFSECNLPQMDAALNRLVRGSPRVREQALNALCYTIAADRSVTRREAELIRAIADAMDCPLPPFLDVSPNSADTVRPA